ncbi:hypothetical protein D9M68_654660 [compost metagenome]
MPGHAGKTLRHFFDADRITRFGEQRGFDFRSDDFGIDENAVAIKNDEIDTGHLKQFPGRRRRRRQGEDSLRGAGLSYARALYEGGRKLNLWKLSKPLFRLLDSIVSRLYL